MARNSEAPKIVDNGNGSGHTRETHPAYGKITISSPKGGARRLCGSSIKHSDTISITVETAEVERKYGTEWVFGKKHVIELELSHAQYAHMIASVSNGDGTPCTIRYVMDGNLVAVPEISDSLTSETSIKNQFKATVTKTISDIDDKINTVKDMVSKGKAGKTELLSILNTLEMTKQQIVQNLPFYVGQFDEHMENKTNDAVMQIEATIGNRLGELGIESARSLFIQNNPATEK
jgi:hypothetical protein